MKTPHILMILSSKIYPVIYTTPLRYQLLFSERCEFACCLILKPCLFYTYQGCIMYLNQLRSRIALITSPNLPWIIGKVGRLFYPRYSLLLLLLLLLGRFRNVVKTIKN